VYQNKGNLCDQVESLANFLRKCCGIKCDIPSYHLNEQVTNWSEYIEKCINNSEYILLVCTKELKESLAGQSHNRVEMTRTTGPYILSSTLKSLLETKPKTLPVILEEGSRKYIPAFLRSTTIYTISFNSLPDAESTDEQATEDILNDLQYKDLRSLVAKLSGQQEIEKPEVAPHPPNLTSKTLFVSI